MARKTTGERKHAQQVRASSWEAAIEQILTSSATPLHYTEIAAQIGACGLRDPVANPVAVVASTFSRLGGGAGSKFLKLGNGLYDLREKLMRTADRPVALSQQDEISGTGALRALGMFWRRDHVTWAGKPRLFGRQGEGASEVDFTEQVGVYLLYDRSRVIYVGRANDTLYARLKAHTADRLAGRWDRFSWFGLRGVTEDGKLLEPSSTWLHGSVIDTFEALLIESLEPPLNRKRGDNLSGIEYLQVKDVTMQNKDLKNALDDLIRSRDG